VDTIYLGDTARVPYGSKSPEVVTQYSLRNARFLAARGIDLLVVACNTASAVALPALRAALGIPVLGVVEPGARVASGASRTGRIGVIGTPGTIASGAYQRAIAGARPGAEVVARACPLFLPLAEEGWTDPDDEVVRAVARRYLAPLAEARIDTLVLGCTHYPLLTGALSLVMGDKVTLVSSAEETAKDVYRRLTEAELLSGGSTPPAPHEFLATGDPEPFARLGQRFLGPEISVVSELSLAVSP
jgi:glutamate racemase